MKQQLNINNRIRARELQVIDDEGKQLGVMPTQDALQLAREKDLDLVEVSPQMNPPIAKIMDYGKYMYRKEKEEAKRGKPKEQERKTVRVGFKTGTHDLDFKAKQVSEFLNEGHIVKVELTLRGREKSLAHIGKQKLEQFLTKLNNFSVQEGVKRSPFGWTIIIKR
mgnify:FL=1